MVVSLKITLLGFYISQLANEKQTVFKALADYLLGNICNALGRTQQGKKATFQKTRCEHD
jgi:hypothetical protein